MLNYLAKVKQTPYLSLNEITADGLWRERVIPDLMKKAFIPFPYNRIEQLPLTLYQSVSVPSAFQYSTGPVPLCLIVI